jgi:predicted dehydrogenase
MHQVKLFIQRPESQSDLQRSSAIDDDSRRKGSKFPGVITVVGGADQCNLHVRAWKLAGATAKRADPKRAFDKLQEGDCVDICCTSFPERERLLDRCLNLGATAIVTGAISNQYDKVQGIFRMTKKKSEKPRLVILDPMKYHPLISKTTDLISSGRVGAPRVLKIEILNYEHSKLSDFSLFQGLLNGVSCAEILLGTTEVNVVFAKKVNTNYSIFYVSLISFKNGTSCQLVAGDSTKQGKLEFSINGTGGMISFNESKTLELPKEVEYSAAISSSPSLEVLTRLFSDLLHGGTEKSANLSTYNLAQKIIDSSLKASSI